MDFYQASIYQETTEKMKEGEFERIAKKQVNVLKEL